jgi:hypothetical protein
MRKFIIFCPISVFWVLKQHSLVGGSTVNTVRRDDFNLNYHRCEKSKFYFVPYLNPVFKVLENNFLEKRVFGQFTPVTNSVAYVFSISETKNKHFYYIHKCLTFIGRQVSC